MDWLFLVPLATQLIQMVEGLFGSGTGAQKKAIVTEGLKHVVTAVDTVSTGGQKKSWDAIAPVSGQLIDLIAGAIYPTAPTGVVTPTPLNP